ncbi:ergothioneine biosynthesis protein EgtB [Vulgatibacter incomptus]|uniref:Serine/threonine kinase n=1 Tax=Vulgatibacter incomptus TaxID=1391653 RepID=A0A0K1PIA2_9BACT|nr:ergothioneine biosynthesis protein EgtB [Vulgatibacter incomptus]AKU93250.1 hypothetical protein AKJ08_3637 [Vulgatibacter incomptus]
MDDLEQGLEEARRSTLRLVEGLTDAEARTQYDPAFSPLAWHLGHVAWQEERWALRHVGGQEPIDPRLDGIYDTFVSEKRSRGRRLPPLEAIRAYAARVRESSLELLRHADPPAHGTFRFLAGHEHQHAETMAVVRLLAGLPLDSAGFAMPATPPAPTGPAFVEIPAGSFVLGAQGDLHAWDNEAKAHPVELPAYRIARDPVTNADWLAFMDDGGYADDRLWDDDGRRWRNEAKAVAPLHWSRSPSGWTRRTLLGQRPVDPTHPVAHVSWHEASAFARFAGARLPTEAEWERAASWAQGAKRRWPWGEGAPPDGVNIGLTIGDTSPCEAHAASPCGARALAGNVWEWTSSFFDAYPGFTAGAYRGYSLPWFGEEHRVLRGGCHLTHPSIARTTFRNWFVPGMRAYPSGLRLAESP